MRAPTSAPLAVVVLAAGQGSRMRSARPKVLHGFAGRSMLGHVLAAAAPLHATSTVVVVGHGRDEVTAHLQSIAPAAVAAVQPSQLGTGHAVGVALAALPAESAALPAESTALPAESAALEAGAGADSVPPAPATVLVLPGDAPLLTPSALTALLAAHTGAGAAATLLSAVVGDPTGYGRVIRSAGGALERVVEHRDATDAQRSVTEVATGVYAFDLASLRAALARIGSDNAQGEQYLPDVVGLLVADGRAVAAVAVDATETAGVNDRVQLAAAHRAYNDRLLEAHMLAGVTVLDPATTWIDADVTLEPDVTLQPAVQLQGRTHVAAGAQVGPDVTLQNTSVGAGAVVSRTVAIGSVIDAAATVGPFAYLRPGTHLHAGVHIGTFVELKNSSVGDGTKIPHLSYVGDTDIGAHSNIGAATVFVNYDGVVKHRSVVGDHVRTGADNMFVAPVQVGDGAYTAAGSVITQDVPPGALGVGRARQRNVAGWVARTRAGTAAAEAAAQAEQRDAAPDDAAPDDPAPDDAPDDQG